jgi:FkbM family methyltransferase
MPEERSRNPAKRATQWAFRKLGYEIHPFEAGGTIQPEDLRRARLLDHQRIDVVVDVGANIGQYARKLRRTGYEGRMVSFEPLADAYRMLERKVAKDENWTCRRLAIGDEEGTITINVSENSYSSSVLAIEDRHVEAEPESRYVSTEEVPITTLDSIWGDLVADGDRVYLKLDVQGFEMAVLRGAERALGQTQVVQAELSLVPLYEGAPLYREVVDHLEARGFALAGLEPGHEEPGSGQMIQADGVFVRQTS